MAKQKRKILEELYREALVTLLEGNINDKYWQGYRDGVRTAIDRLGYKIVEEDGELIVR